MPIDYQTLTELIHDARTSRERTDAELASTLIKVEELRKQQQQLREEEDAYVATLTRRFPDAQQDLAPIDDESFDLGVDFAPQVDWNAMPRTVAVERAIAEITKDQASASPGEIEMLLRRYGRMDGRDEIGGAVAHLNRTEKIRSLGRAQWVINEQD